MGEEQIMVRKWIRRLVVPLSVIGGFVLVTAASRPRIVPAVRARGSFDDVIVSNATQMIGEGRQTFRFATFGDQVFWGDTLKRHQAIEGAANGGVGGGLSPSAALSLGLKVDVDALPQPLIEDLRRGRVNLNDPAVTLALLKLNAVLGVTGFFNSGGTLSSVGIQCALCHSRVDDSFAPGIGHRLDGWPNRDLNVGAIIAFAPDLSSVATLLMTTQPDVRNVLNGLGGRQVRRGAPPRRQDLRAQRLRGDAHPARLRVGGREPPHLDRMGLRAALERFRREPGNAWSRPVLGSALEQRGSVPDRGGPRLRESGSHAQSG